MEMKSDSQEYPGHTALSYSSEGDSGLRLLIHRGYQSPVVLIPIHFHHDKLFFVSTHFLFYEEQNQLLADHYGDSPSG